MGYVIFHFGSLYFGDKVQNVEQNQGRDRKPVSYDGLSDIFIGGTAPMAAIHWVKPSGMNLFVANRVLMTSVSWDDLAQNRFTQGQKIWIDGQLFRCRLLQVGMGEGGPNEWDRILDEAGEANTLWHWADYYFWGSDVPDRRKRGADCAIRGYYGARIRGSAPDNSRANTIGFRPVLEAIPSDILHDPCILDGEKFYVSSVPGDKMYCPILQPLESDNFKSVLDGKQVKMYAILEDGQPLRAGDEFKDRRNLRITDKYFGDEFLISWSISNGVAVANGVLYQKK